MKEKQSENSAKENNLTARNLSSFSLLSVVTGKIQNFPGSWFWDIYFYVSVIALGLGQNLIFSIVRGETSQLLGSDYQGKFRLCLWHLVLCLYSIQLHYYCGIMFLLLSMA